MTTVKVQCISPIDGSIFAERDCLDEAAAMVRINKARVAQQSWQKRPLAERIAVVKEGVKILGQMNDRIVPELAWMMGRPVRYGGEFGGVSERTMAMSELAESSLAPVLVEQSDRFERMIKREPHGLVFVIAPWNYPYLTAINTIMPALIAGNGVILKHASQTLLAGENIASAMHVGGVPEDLFINLFLDHKTTEALIRRRAFDFINFTGSVAGGRMIETASAGTFVGTGLELGGKDPGYVMADANLEKAVETLVDAAMYNSGQCCCGIERIYVHESLYDEFVDLAVASVAAYRLGNPLDKDTTLGPMANIRFANEVRQQTKEALAAGARAMLDPKHFSNDDGGAYLAPQVLTNVTHAMRVMRDESFGPVVGIMKVRNDAEAIALMNDCAYGLTASLWTQDSAHAAAIGEQLQTGTVFMNRADYLDPLLCWTGCKDTGRGGSLSVIGFHNLTRPKSYHLKKA